MRDSIYNILWIDDEHETLGGTKGRAKRNGINLVPFKSLNGGIGELSRNYPNYDGVLLDAKFFENEDDTKGSEDTFNVHRAKDELLQFKKKFEIFVLTGQAEAYDDQTFQKAFTKVYRKGSDEEIDRLFNDIKEAASGQLDTQIRHNHKRAFEVCTEKYIGEAAGEDLLNLLKIDDDGRVENHFNSIRKIVEDLFLAFHKFNLLPTEFVQPQIALNQTSIFLSGKDQYENTDDRFKVHKHLSKTHLPLTVSSLLRNILLTVQAGSHRSEIDKHVQLVRNSYLAKSTVYQLLDLLVWFKIYVDSAPITNNWKKNKSDEIPMEVDNNWIQGEIINYDSIKGFAFLSPEGDENNQYIPAHLVNKYGLKNGDTIKGKIEEFKDHRTGDIKTRISIIEFL